VGQVAGMAEMWKVNKIFGSENMEGRDHLRN
jgi:hypothetical protein